MFLVGIAGVKDGNEALNQNVTCTERWVGIQVLHDGVCMFWRGKQTCRSWWV